jgi:hypothetical protein
VFDNNTRNQHFVSQVEQRLNALNPTARKENQRIFEFRVVDREAPVLALTAPKGRKIEDNLAFDDLFSFDASGHSDMRSNLESQFGVYEQNLGTHSRSLLHKLAGATPGDIEEDLLQVFASKFLNFVRNPNCVTKVLNTVGEITNYKPTDPVLRKAFQQIKRGSRRHQGRVCKRFGLTAAAYERWLSALFLLLTKPVPKQPNPLEATIKGLFESKAVFVQVYEYVTAKPAAMCLLSDRGFNVPVSNAGTFAFEFNLRARAFVRYCFVDPAHHIPSSFRPELRERVAARVRARVDVRRFQDDLTALATYNQLTAFQCAANVYAAHASPLLHA